MSRKIMQVRIWNPEKACYEYSGGTPSMLAVFYRHTAKLFTFHEQEYEYSTGFKDKNGVEIYEDDIYKDAHGIVYLVQMKVDGWGLFPVKKDSPVRSLYWRNVYIHDAGAVIGNRHQNPELLEDK